jgi:hypothetical protein
MTSALDPQVLHFLARDEVVLTASIGVILLCVMSVALVAKVLLESASPGWRRDTQRLLNVVVIPLLLMFVAVVIDRFVHLS